MPATAGYFKGVREICDRHGIMLIADEVMTAFGRTGAWWAVDHWGVVPDLITMANLIVATGNPANQGGKKFAGCTEEPFPSHRACLAKIRAKYFPGK